MDKDYQNERYEPPEMELLFAEVELGFAGSDPSGTIPGWQVVSDLHG